MGELDEVTAEFSEELPLSVLFKRAQEIYDEAESLSVRDPKSVDRLRNGVRILQLCERHMATLGLFSPNEEIDDVATADLKYLLVPCMAGELQHCLPADDAEHRLSILQSAQRPLKAFVSQCEALGLMSAEEREAAGNEVSSDPATRRAQKIARHRRQKALEGQLAALEERRQARSGARRKQQSGQEIDEDDTAADEQMDDPDERKAWLLRISLALDKALDLTGMLKREEEMLKSAAQYADAHPDGRQSLSRESLDLRTQQAMSRHMSASRQAYSSRPSAPIHCSTFAQNVIEGRQNPSHKHTHGPGHVVFGPSSMVGGALTTDRERIVAQVFQPSHSLPTMSIEEAGLAEMELNKIFERQNQEFLDMVNEGRPPRKEREPREKGDEEGEEDEGEEEDDGDENEEEEKLMKQRAWDEWQEDHPKGQGNSKLTPCG
eukprot:jgi/Mesen1/2511/ME000016S01859